MNPYRQLPLESVLSTNRDRRLTNGRFRDGPSAFRDALYDRYAERLVVNPDLTRSLVSFQANKQLPFYRWLKYKEGFSADLVRYCMAHHTARSRTRRRLLDPFAGTGTALIAAAREGWQALGIELLPVGVAAIRARMKAVHVDVHEFRRQLERLGQHSLEQGDLARYGFRHLRITEKAFPQETEQALAVYRAFLEEIHDEDVRYLFGFACLSILEEISFTRKDGQYLRWDVRSGRSRKSTFHKGPIRDFRAAITEKLQLMLYDTEHECQKAVWERINVIEGSCLTELAQLPDRSCDLVITSPPYCNRYDYTRTYALELAFLGYDDEKVKQHRQRLLSATVENKSKRAQLEAEYRGRDQLLRYQEAVAAFEIQKALHEVLGLLRVARAEKRLNNSNIPDLVENYFFEMNVVVHELARVLGPGGRIFMVNDNVQYAGEEVPVDLILSDFAEHAGLQVERIWMLPRGKGNSSQQMGHHGRNEIRKCVCIWCK